jgi:hypothetical protein
MYQWDAWSTTNEEAPCGCFKKEDKSRDPGNVTSAYLSQSFSATPAILKAS